MQWLAHPEVHETLVAVWRDARAWLMGRYVIMPDHIHFFAVPGELEIRLEKWLQYWKSMFAKQHARPRGRWQPDCWDTWLLGRESYESKWEYVRQNPCDRAS